MWPTFLCNRQYIPLLPESNGHSPRDVHKCEQNVGPLGEEDEVVHLPVNRGAQTPFVQEADDTPDEVVHRCYPPVQDVPSLDLAAVLLPLEESLYLKYCGVLEI